MAKKSQNNVSENGDKLTTYIEALQANRIMIRAYVNTLEDLPAMKNGSIKEAYEMVILSMNELSDVILKENASE